MKNILTKVANAFMPGKQTTLTAPTDVTNEVPLYFIKENGTWRQVNLTEYRTYEIENGHVHVLPGKTTSCDCFKNPMIRGRVITFLRELTLWDKETDFQKVLRTALQNG
jgi:hypothetical protein